MRKLLILLISLGIIGGSVYALFPGLFPDTPLFPRVPTGGGTVGAILEKILGTSDLANYASDGAVKNTLALSGVPASDYLKKDVLCGGSPVAEKFVGIDANGNRICGTTTTLLADYGKIESQDCQAHYYRADGSDGSTATGNTLKAGDIIKTSPGCTMTIAFSDLSILRIDGDTTVSLDLGYLPNGSTIASAIVANGSLWGRILTETGSYSIGTDTVVAGVRGTSLSVVSTGHTILPLSYIDGSWHLSSSISPYPTKLHLVDSASMSGASIYCRHLAMPEYTQLPNLRKDGSYTIPPEGCNSHIAALPTLSDAPTAELFVVSPWIRENTRKDITYLYKLLALSGSIIPETKKTIIQGEISSTIPAIDAALGVLSATGVLEASKLCSDGERWWNQRYGCQNVKVLAIADYGLPNIDGGLLDPPFLSVYTPTGIQNIPSRKNGNITYSIGNGVTFGSSSYISYPRSEIESYIGNIQYKKIRIKVSNEVPPTASNSYLIFFTPTDTLKRGAAGFICGSSLCSTPPYSSLIQEYTYKITSSSSDFYIGGKPGSTSPNTTIEKIIIENF